MLAPFKRRTMPKSKSRLIILAVLLVVILSLLNWLFYLGPRISRQNLEQAQELLRQGKPAEAVEPATKALDHLDHLPETQFTLAEAITLSGGDTVAALDHYRRAHRYDTASYPYALRLAQIERMAGDPKNASPILDQLMVTYPDSAQAYYERGLIYAREGDLDRAYELYTKSLELDGSNIDAIRSRGQQLEQLKDFQGAMEDWSKLIERGEDDGTLQAKRGEFRIRIGDYPAGIQDLETAIAKGIDRPGMRIALGQAYLNSKQGEKADSAVTAAIAKYPESDSLRQLQAFVYLRTEQPKRAIKAMDRLIEKTSKPLQAQDAKMYYLRGIAHTQVGQYQASIRDYTTAIQADKSNTDAIFNRGLSYAYSQQYGAAIRDYTTVLERKPKDALTHFVRAAAKIAIDDRRTGCLDAQRALELGYKDAQGMINQYCQ